MKKKINYTDEPMDNVQVVPDFLPRPDQLVFRERVATDIEITTCLSPQSLAFFKEKAAAWHTDYRVIIQSVLDEYSRVLSK